jgi:hypothetical protein
MRAEQKNLMKHAGIAIRVFSAWLRSFVLPFFLPRCFFSTAPNPAACQQCIKRASLKCNTKSNNKKILLVACIRELLLFCSLFAGVFSPFAAALLLRYLISSSPLCLTMIYIFFRVC